MTFKWNKTIDKPAIFQMIEIRLEKKKKSNHKKTSGNFEFVLLKNRFK